MSAHNHRILKRIRDQALTEGLTYTSYKNECVNANYFPTQHSGFTVDVYKRHAFTCETRVDSKAVVSLALYDRQTPTLRSYATKLPIMCINANRFIYTKEAFAYRGISNDVVNATLQFYVDTDISHVDDKVLSANERFSKLLHTLASTGYEEYIFKLASHLDLDVDLIKNDLLYRYKRNHTAHNSVDGVLTALYHECKWYVNITATHRVCIK